MRIESERGQLVIGIFNIPKSSLDEPLFCFVLLRSYVMMYILKDKSDGFLFKRLLIISTEMKTSIDYPYLNRLYLCCLYLFIFFKLTAHKHG